MRFIALVSLIAVSFFSHAAARASTQLSDVKTAEFRGKLYAASPSLQSRVGVLLIGGSEGQLLLADSVGPRIAALGYSVLGVDYHGGFADRSRPLANVPVEQFVAAAEWLLKQRGIQRVVVIGESRGSEAALLTALHSSSVSGVIGVVPSIYVWSAVGSADAAGPSGWSKSGTPLTFVKPIKDESPDAATFTKSVAADKDIEQATIAIEKIRVPVLLIGGDDDAVWPSGDFVRAAQARIKRMGVKVALDARVYPAAGHRLFGTGASSPTESYAWDGGVFVARYGGTELGNARARADAWKAIAQFLAVIEKKD